MQKAFYTVEKRTTIYALVCRRGGCWVYVGKTTSPRISAVYSRHRCSEVGATRGFCDRPEYPPELYVLEHLRATGAEAYRYVLAWLRCFLEHGYTAMTHGATENQAWELHPETEKIYREIGKESLETVLTRTYVARPADANLPPEPQPLVQTKAEREKTEQMNVRMSRENKLRFEAFCRAHEVNQRQGFALLLEQPGEQSILAEMQRKIRKQEAEIKKLRSRLDAQSGRAEAPAEQEARGYLQFLLPELKAYLDYLFFREEPPEPLPNLNFRKFQRTNPQADLYIYPENEGFYQLVPEAVVWGISRSRPCFVMFRGEHGERYKLRTYPKDHYAGFSFRSPLPVEPGTKWQIGVRKAKDGAMEIVAAFPIPGGTEPDSHEEAVIQQKCSLDSMIRSAKKAE